MKVESLLNLLAWSLTVIGVCALSLLSLGLFASAYVRFFGMMMVERSVIDFRAGWLDLEGGLLCAVPVLLLWRVKASADRRA